MSSIFSVNLLRLMIDEADYAFYHVIVIFTHSVDLSVFYKMLGE